MNEDLWGLRAQAPDHIRRWPPFAVFGCVGDLKVQSVLPLHFRGSDALIVTLTYKQLTSVLDVGLNPPTW